MMDFNGTSPFVFKMYQPPPNPSRSGQARTMWAIGVAQRTGILGLDVQLNIPTNRKS
jgi:hypothetical protein